jgi:hypothetical protein
VPGGSRPIEYAPDALVPLDLTFRDPVAPTSMCSSMKAPALPAPAAVTVPETDPPTARSKSMPGVVTPAVTTIGPPLLTRQ